MKMYAIDLTIQVGFSFAGFRYFWMKFYPGIDNANPGLKIVPNLC